jgi:hypothetical protein
MNGGREGRLQGLAGQLEIMKQSNKFNE